jgi:uncharacterized protein YyaL (SSP411 family)
MGPAAFDPQPGGQPRHANRLSRQNSPYLLAHAHQRVDWYPWGEEAFERALHEEMPIFLSIGYSACHWCHVQSHESFEDPAIAALLNELFVCIKVDREERPDIDHIYQVAQALLTRRGGGWPLSMFLMHDDRRPFFGGTYFPPEARHGLPAFKDVLLRVAQYYRERREELRAQTLALGSAFTQLEAVQDLETVQLTGAPLLALREQLERRFDRVHGGFGGAPKFPHAEALDWLLRQARRTPHSKPDTAALLMVAKTLQEMARGGIQDHLAGGFCRYSVDERWEIPHFEKMLYDNAALLALYAQAGRYTGDALLTHTAHSLADWALRDMQAPQGGFYCSFDADSEGQEGKYYIWDRDEVRQLLSTAEYTAFAPQYGLTGAPNFEGRWHLHLVASWRSEPLIESARARLLAARRLRVPPARDDKILTSWNALMIRALAIAARMLARPDLGEAATRALDFLRATHVCDGRLLAASRNGRAHLNAYLDDHVFLVDAILELQQLRFRQEELALACHLLDTVLMRFEDRQNGGFYFTADDHETLFHRSRAFGGAATPSGSAVAARVLQQLGHLLGESRYLTAAERTLRAAWPHLQQDPMSHTTLLTALAEWSSPPTVIIVRGEPQEIESWRSALADRYAPQQLVLAIPEGAAGLPPALAARGTQDRAVAYVCRGRTCSLPIKKLPELLAVVADSEDGPEN